MPSGPCGLSDRTWRGPAPDSVRIAQALVQRRAESPQWGGQRRPRPAPRAGLAWPVGAWVRHAAMPRQAPQAAAAGPASPVRPWGRREVIPRRVLRAQAAAARGRVPDRPRRIPPPPERRRRGGAGRSSSGMPTDRSTSSNFQFRSSATTSGKDAAFVAAYRSRKSASGVYCFAAAHVYFRRFPKFTAILVGYRRKCR